ncbi:MAG TPA: SpoIIE family protein phosphatase [Acidimicrobiales bacterium]|nr:SpoIIE family protein phosphatase [Acidimicrobiales bacterium]
MSTPAGTWKGAADRLRDIESVTDAGLARLSVDDLLDELLDRVRDILDADTAAILLLDSPAGQLVATAARGLEDEVYQGMRVPLGRGFAGRVAARKRPVAIEDVEAADVVNPILRAKGIRSLLGVPLLAGDRLLGVLHVGTRAARHFSPAEIDLLQMVADRVALATQARISDTERRAAVVLQRSLLPERVPQVPGLEVAIRYSAGGEGEVGGDWYDLFTLPSGWVCMTVGDVVGRGLRAAGVMGRLRSAVRAYALSTRSDPAAILDRIDRMLRQFEPGEMATAVLALLEPSFERLHLSLAGHPAPVVATDDGPATYVDAPVDPPLGVAASIGRRVTTVDLPPGGVVCLYSDGLVERRSVPLDARLRLLREAVSARPAEEVCTTVMVDLIGPDRPTDDVALLTVRRLDFDSAEPLDLTVPAVASSLRDIRAAVKRWLATIGAGPEDVMDVVLAVGEATSNVVEHAYGPRGGLVHVRLELQNHDVLVTVRDSGRWRSPRGHNRGRGTSIIEAVTDELTVDRRSDGTEVLIRRRLEAGPPR